MESVPTVQEHVAEGCTQVSVGPFEGSVGVRQGEDVGDGAVCEPVVAVHHKFGYSEEVRTVMTWTSKRRTADQNRGGRVPKRRRVGNAMLREEKSGWRRPPSSIQRIRVQRQRL